MQDAAPPPADGTPARRSPSPTDRHRAAVLGYARLCCPDGATARRLVDEAARTLPTAGAPRPELVAALRRTAARWADTGREAELSAGFRSWLHAAAARHPGAGLAGALAAVEQEAPLLQAFRRLPAHRQEELWHGLGPDGDLRPPAPPARAALFDTYLQVYVARVPARACRQLVARLGDTVRRGSAPEPGLADHLAGCGPCGTACTELAAVRDWHRPVLTPALLLWTGEAPPCPPVGPAVPSPPTAAPRRPAPVRTVVGAAAAVLLLVLAVAAALPGHTPAPTAAVPVPTGAEPAPPSPTPTTTTATSSTPPTPAPTATRPAPAPTPSPTPSRTTPPPVPPPVPPPSPVVTVTVTLIEP
ncbi:hypothetical protein [Kitasatospora arboriphila]|uniref:Sigma-70 family RNA polymerase sigma factor n=1 Tax=Kitasatospora arboriphila TaxID=258052 RepID=A0ABP4EGK3_9ACTN